ncbi:MAG: NADH-quinone oxidoreductase subunit N, partial [Actinobacteria bacterium]
PLLGGVGVEWAERAGEFAPAVTVPGGLTATALTIGVAATLLLGVAPQMLLDLTADAAEFVR